MAKAKRGWYRVESKPAKPVVPDSIKTELKAKADALIEKVLFAEHVKPPKKGSDSNYIIEIGCKWHGIYFYFFSIYACPSENAIAPTFEYKFARMEYVGENLFAIAYMRHTEKFWELGRGLSMDVCLKAIVEGGHFLP